MSSPNAASTRHAVQIAAICAFIAFTHVCRSFAQQALTIEDQVTQLEASWPAGGASAQYEYFARAGSIAAGLYAHESASASAAALRLLNNLLAKAADSPSVGAADLIAKARVARFMLANRSESAGPRKEQLEALGRLLGQVRRELVANYSPRPVYLNIAPAPGYGPTIAGMNPDAISDASERQQYVAAIHKNEEDNRMNKRQAELRQMEHELSARIADKPQLSVRGISVD